MHQVHTLTFHLTGQRITYFPKKWWNRKLLHIICGSTQGKWCECVKKTTFTQYYNLSMTSFPWRCLFHRQCLAVAWHHSRCKENESETGVWDAYDTTIQSTEFHNPVSQQTVQHSCLQMVWHVAKSCHFLVEAFIIISHIIRHCICSMHNILTCSCVFFKFIFISCYPSSDTGGTKVYAWQSLHLSCFSLTKNLITLHWQTVVTDCHIFSQYTAETPIRTETPNLYSHKRDCQLTPEPCI